MGAVCSGSAGFHNTYVPVPNTVAQWKTLPIPVIEKCCEVLKKDDMLKCDPPPGERFSNKKLNDRRRKQLKEAAKIVKTYGKRLAGAKLDTVAKALVHWQQALQEAKVSIRTAVDFSPFCKDLVGPMLSMSELSVYCGVFESIDHFHTGTIRQADIEVWTANVTDCLASSVIIPAFFRVLPTLRSASCNELTLIEFVLSAESFCLLEDSELVEIGFRYLQNSYDRALKQWYIELDPCEQRLDRLLRQAQVQNDTDKLIISEMRSYKASHPSKSAAKNFVCSLEEFREVNAHSHILLFPLFWFYLHLKKKLFGNRYWKKRRKVVIEHRNKMGLPHLFLRPIPPPGDSAMIYDPTGKKQGQRRKERRDSRRKSEPLVFSPEARKEKIQTATRRASTGPVPEKKEKEAKPPRRNSILHVPHGVEEQQQMRGDRLSRMRPSVKNVYDGASAGKKKVAPAGMRRRSVAGTGEALTKDLSGLGLDPGVAERKARSERRRQRRSSMEGKDEVGKSFAFTAAKVKREEGKKFGGKGRRKSVAF